MTIDVRQRFTGVALACALAALTGCSGGGTTCTGPGCGVDEGGAPTSSGGGGAGNEPTASPSDPGTTSGGAGSDAGKSNECVSDGKTCYCGPLARQPQQSGQPVASCSLASVGGNWCCASAEYPSNGACWCLTATPNCHRSAFGDSCLCSHASPSQGDKPVATCSAKAGGICCVQPGDIAPMCACYDTLKTCPSGSPVPSCDTSQLRCEGRAVDVCQ